MRRTSMLVLSLFVVLFLLNERAAERRALAQQKVDARQAEVSEILSHMSIVYLDDGKGKKLKTIRISDVNVQIVNGTGRTGAPQGKGTGLGNLIVGYNETGNPLGDDRSGSHCIVVGEQNSYGVGCFVAGKSNSALGTFSAVL